MKVCKASLLLLISALLLILVFLFHVHQKITTHVWEKSPHTTEVVISDEHKVVYVENVNAGSSKFRRAIETVLHADRSNTDCSTTGCLNATHDDYFFFSFVRHPVKKFESGVLKVWTHREKTLRNPTADELLERQLDRLKQSGSNYGGLSSWFNNNGPWINKVFQSNIYSLTGSTPSDGPVRLDFVGCFEDLYADLARAADLYDESTASSTPCAAAHANATTADPPRCGLRRLSEHLSSEHQQDTSASNGDSDVGVDASLLSDNGIARLCASEEFNSTGSADSSAPLAGALNRYNCVIPKGSKPRILSAPTTSADTTATCCYSTQINIAEVYNEAYFADQQTRWPDIKWNGNEYEEWKQISSKFVKGGSCETEWMRVVLVEAESWYLRKLMDYELGRHFPGSRIFQYVEERPSSPRVLFLGDSISQGTAEELYVTFHETTDATLVTAPTNCGGFSRYDEMLDQWLGDCPWDVIQFNVGMHYHPFWPTINMNILRSEDIQEKYESQLERVVRRLRAHSPGVAVIFALTTPSPLDSEATTPDRESCKHFDKFHPAGFVPMINSIAREFLTTLNVTINDRYGAVIPSLELYQNPCDIHYKEKGYQHLASQDWEVVSGLLVERSKSQAILDN